MFLGPAKTGGITQDRNMQLEGRETYDSSELAQLFRKVDKLPSPWPARRRGRAGGFETGSGLDLLFLKYHFGPGTLWSN